MQKAGCYVAFCALVLVLLIPGTSFGAQETVKGGKEKAVVEMTASNFEFEPVVIRAHTGDISLEIKNTSSGTHNFTVKNPKDQVITSTDLPPNQKTLVKISLKEPGVYEFYCDKLLHATMGMKGRLEVSQ